jgi:cytoskeletal protein CcmA (bactofilin family)
MFRRKDEEYDTNDLLQDVMSGIEDDELIETPEAEKKADQSTDATTASSAPQAPAKPAAPSTPVATKPTASATFRPQAAQAMRSNNVPAAAVAATPPAAANSNPKPSKRVLTVGHDIHMKGEISTCDRLVIEGSVDATLSDVHTVEIAQTGSFKGTAEIEDAEISGAFEGDLIVNGRLTIYASGSVSGNVSYGEIEIERGGKLTGTITTADAMKASQKPMKKAA